MFLYYSCLFSLVYAVVETIYRKIASNTVTTFGQTVITFIWAPVIVYHFNYFDYWSSIVLFPLNIWLCELMCGGFMLYFYNKRYWFYNDNLSFFNGLISIYFTIYWILLGYIINIFLTY